jgi:hypothetical protein
MKKLLSVAAMALAVFAVTAGTASANVSFNQAADGTIAYAKRACFHYGPQCHSWGENNCIRHSSGISCKAWNYITYHSRKYACQRLVFWKSANNYQFISKWKCFRGWYWGPPAKRA